MGLVCTIEFDWFGIELTKSRVRFRSIIPRGLCRECSPYSKLYYDGNFEFNICTEVKHDRIERIHYSLNFISGIAFLICHGLSLPRLSSIPCTTAAIVLAPANTYSQRISSLYCELLNVSTSFLHFMALVYLKVNALSK